MIKDSFEHKVLNSNNLFFISTSTYSIALVVERASSKNELCKPFLWLLSAFVHNCDTRVSNNVRSLWAKVDASRAKWLPLKCLIKINLLSIRSFLIRPISKNLSFFFTNKWVTRSEKHGKEWAKVNIVSSYPLPNNLFCLDFCFQPM